MPARWLVDGMNVIGSRPDGWWRDRAGAMRSLVCALEAFAAATGDEVAVVLDGRPMKLAAGERTAIEVAFAPSADDAIAARVAADLDPGTLTVVTSDAELRRRVAPHGAAVAGAGAFRRSLDASAG